MGERLSAVDARIEGSSSVGARIEPRGDGAWAGVSPLFTGEGAMLLPRFFCILDLKMSASSAF